MHDFSFHLSRLSVSRLPRFWFTTAPVPCSKVAGWQRAHHVVPYMFFQLSWAVNLHKLGWLQGSSGKAMSLPPSVTYDPLEKYNRNLSCILTDCLPRINHVLGTSYRDLGGLLHGPEGLPWGCPTDKASTQDPPSRPQQHVSKLCHASGRDHHFQHGPELYNSWQRL